MRSERVDVRIARLAARQHGVFRREQAVALGATKHVIDGRLKQGRWERVAPAVYRVTGSADGWRQSLLVACFAWGAGAAASHRGGAPLWSLAGCAAGVVELTVPPNRNRAGPGLVHRGALPVADVTLVDAIPVTTPARTLIDLAAVVPADDLEEALDDALRRGLVSIRRMRWRLDELARRGRPGVTAIRRLLEARDPSMAIPESVLERRLLRTLRGSGLPAPVLQHEIRIGGRLIAIVDFAYPDVRLAIEADGFRWHAGRRRFDHDRERRNQLTLLGWRIIHVTWTDLVHRPATVTAAIATALAAEH